MINELFLSCALALPPANLNSYRLLAKWIDKHSPGAAFFPVENPIRLPKEFIIAPFKFRGLYVCILEAA